MNVIHLLIITGTAMLFLVNIPMIFSEVPSLMYPLQQLRQGVLPENITCNQDLHLLIKSSDNTPACVTSSSISRLVSQGWIVAPETTPFNQNNTTLNHKINPPSHTLGIVLVPYFAPTNNDWQTIYNLAAKYPGTIRYVIINPCSGPCDTPLSSDWQNAISILKSDGVKTLGYIFDNSQSIANIDYYMKNPQVKTDGIFFDNEGSSGDNSVRFKPYSDHVHQLGGIVYINPGYPYPYIANYLQNNLTDIANVHEPNLDQPHDISIPYNVSPSRLSVMLGNVSSASDMKSEIAKVAASKDIGNVFIYENSYDSLPSFFSQEVQAISAMP